MRIRQLFQRNLKELYRDPPAVVLLLALPLLLMLILRLADVHAGYLAPVVAASGLLVMISTVLWAWSRDKSSGYLSLLRTTPTPLRDLFLGYFFSAVVVAAVEAILLLIFAWMLGA